jgi:hypothetical protein
METGKHRSISTVRIGDTAPELVVALSRINPQLKSLSFTIYLPVPGVDERVGDVDDTELREIARNFLHHDYSSNKQWLVDASELTIEMIRAKIASIPPGLALGLESKCTFHDSTTRYIPMVDFKPSPSEHNLELLKCFLKELAFPGSIVDSGGSYHFYGFDFLNEREWIEFMGKCLLIPWSDSRWIAHSLIAGGGDLRISATDQKPKLPSVVEVLT